MWLFQLLGKSNHYCSAERFHSCEKKFSTERQGRPVLQTRLLHFKDFTSQTATAEETVGLVLIIPLHKCSASGGFNW